MATSVRRIWRSGMYWIREHVDEAIELLRGCRWPAPVVHAVHLTKSAYVEYSAKNTESCTTELAHTNHFLHPDFVPRDELNIFARNSSVRRFEYVSRRLATVSPDADVESHFAFCPRPICVLTR